MDCDHENDKVCPQEGGTNIDAMELVAAGVSVIPVNTDKRPLFRLLPTVDGKASWNPYQHEIADAETLRRWIDARPWGFARVCGAVSGHLETIDFDRPEGWADDTPERTLVAWLNEVEIVRPGLASRLTVCATPKGRHVVFRCAEPVDSNTKLAEVQATGPSGEPLFLPSGKPKPATLIETRGEGGYAVTPPTPGYRHLDGPPLTAPSVITADERQTLLAVAWALDELPDDPQPETPPSAAYSGELRPGTDFIARGEWEPLLDALGLDFACEANGSTYLKRRGSRNPVGAKVGWRGNDKLYVYSTNLAIEARKAGYDKYGVFARLYHNGDTSAASSALRKLGYGESPKPTAKSNAKTEDNAPPRPLIVPQIRTVRQLASAFQKMREPIIDGFLRRGETANLIAPPKTGKSWLAYSLALSVATGQRWLGRFETAAGKVLIIDNELHEETAASRIPYVAQAMGLDGVHLAGDWREDVHVDNLRGRLVDLIAMEDYFAAIEPSTYSVIVLDAWYRFLPSEASENDNGAVARLYNALDRYANRLNCAFINIHHSTKGDQSGKSVVDVGAGAGSQARAADTHIVLRKHEHDSCHTLDAAVRSWKPIDPVVLQWSYPLWSVADHLDPAALLTPKAKSDSRQDKSDREGMDAVIRLLQTSGPTTKRKLRDHIGAGPDRINRLIFKLLESEQIEETEIESDGQKYTALRLVGEVDDC